VESGTVSACAVITFTGKACGPAGAPALAPSPHPATIASAPQTTACTVNFFIIINFLCYLTLD
jgi:hypothetical protein